MGRKGKYSKNTKARNLGGKKQKTIKNYENLVQIHYHNRKKVKDQGS